MSTCQGVLLQVWGSNSQYIQPTSTVDRPSVSAVIGCRNPILSSNKLHVHSLLGAEDHVSKFMILKDDMMTRSNPRKPPHAERLLSNCLSVREYCA